MVKKKKAGRKPRPKLNLVFYSVKTDGFPKEDGRYLVKAPTANEKIPFFGIGFFLAKKGEEEWGFWVYPEEFIPYITDWAKLP